MDVLFTFPRANVQKYSIEQLKVTCDYLHLQYNDQQTKKQLQNLVIPYFDHLCNPKNYIHYRTEINYQNKTYYVNVDEYFNYKRIIRSYIDCTREVYQLYYSKIQSFHVTYSILQNKWITKRDNENYSLNCIKKAYTYLDLQNLYRILQLFKMNQLLIPDICDYIFNHYNTTLNLQTVYKIL